MWFHQAAAVFLLSTIISTHTLKLKTWHSIDDSPKIHKLTEKTCDVTDYGAKGDNKTLNTAAIQSAIDDCASKGGGMVKFPSKSKTKETVYVSGPIFLKSDIIFFLDTNTRLLGTSNKSSSIWIETYTRRGGTMTMAYSSLLNGGRCSKIHYDKNKIGDQCEKWDKLENVVIAGSGVIDGNGHSGWYNKPYSSVRPCLLNIMWVSGLTIRDVTLTNSPSWTTHPLFSNKVLIENVTIDTDGPNTDGIDPDSCEDVIIRGCRITTGDDCIAIKSGSNADGRAVGRRTANVLVEDMVFGRGHGISIGSEMSGDVVDVLFRNLSLTGTDRGPRIKSEAGRGGMVANITYENLRVMDVEMGISVSMLYHKTTGVAPVFRNITVKNMTGHAQRAGEFLCLPDSPCKEIHLNRVYFANNQYGFNCENAYGTAVNVDPPSCLKQK